MMSHDQKALDNVGYAYIPLENNQALMSISDMIQFELDANSLEYEMIPATQYHITLTYAQGAGREVLEFVANSFTFQIFGVIASNVQVFRTDQQYIVLELERNGFLDSLQKVIFEQTVLGGAIPSEYSFPQNYKPHITLASCPLNVQIPLAEINLLLGGIHVFDVNSVRFSTDNYRFIAETSGVVVKDLDFILNFINHHKAYESGFKALDSETWIAWYTNNFEDKEQEIVSLKALKDSIDAANKGEYPMPELWFFHIEGTRHGIADKLFLIGHFALAIGTFDNEQENEFVSIMKSWYDTQDTITLSQGFFYDPKQKVKGVYNWIRTREISTLPKGSEANPYTQFQIMQQG